MVLDINRSRENYCQGNPGAIGRVGPLFFATGRLVPGRPPSSVPFGRSRRTHHTTQANTILKSSALFCPACPAGPANLFARCVLAEKPLLTPIRARPHLLVPRPGCSFSRFAPSLGIPCPAFHKFQKFHTKTPVIPHIPHPPRPYSTFHTVRRPPPPLLHLSAVSPSCDQHRSKNPRNASSCEILSAAATELLSTRPTHSIQFTCCPNLPTFPTGLAALASRQSG